MFFYEFRNRSNHKEKITIIANNIEHAQYFLEKFCVINAINSTDFTHNHTTIVEEGVYHHVPNTM